MIVNVNRKYVTEKEVANQAGRKGDEKNKTAETF